jgi:hypothetical protein
MNRIHGLPESCVMKRGNLAITRKLFKGLALPTGRIALDIPAYLRRQNKESTINPLAVSTGLFREGTHM